MAGASLQELARILGTDTVSPSAEVGMCLVGAAGEGGVSRCEGRRQRSHPRGFRDTVDAGVLRQLEYPRGATSAGGTRSKG